MDGASLRHTRRPISWELCSQTLTLRCTMCAAVREEPNYRRNAVTLETSCSRGLTEVFQLVHLDTGVGWENSASGITDGMRSLRQYRVDVVSRVVQVNRIVFLLTLAVFRGVGEHLNVDVDPVRWAPYMKAGSPENFTDVGDVMGSYENGFFVEVYALTVDVCARRSFCASSHGALWSSVCVRLGTVEEIPRPREVHSLTTQGQSTRGSKRSPTCTCVVWSQQL